MNIKCTITNTNTNVNSKEDKSGVAIFWGDGWIVSSKIKLPEFCTLDMMLYNFDFKYRYTKVNRGQEYIFWGEGEGICFEIIASGSLWRLERDEIVGQDYVQKQLQIQILIQKYQRSKGILCGEGWIVSSSLWRMERDEIAGTVNVGHHNVQKTITNTNIVTKVPNVQGHTL